MDQEILKLRQEILALRAEVNILKRESKTTSKKKIEQEEIDVTSEEFWFKVRKSFEEGDTDWIKVLLKERKISVFDTDPTYNRTMLIEASKWGYYEIAELCLSFGGDCDHKDKDGLTALDHAQAQGWFRSEQVLLFNTKNMNSNKIRKIRDHEKIVRKQEGFVQNICNELKEPDAYDAPDAFKQTSLKLIINMIEKRLNFSDDFLVLTWQFASDNHNNDPLQSDLWAAIKFAIQDILSKGSKRDWFWLKTCIFTSQIWYLRVNEDEEIGVDVDDDGKQEEKKEYYNPLNDVDIVTKIKDHKSYLYYKLLELVNNACKTGMTKLETNLKKVINKYKTQWDTLCTWESDDRFLIVRNDTIPNSIKSQYTYNALSRQHEGEFNAARFYDMNGFLSEMILLAQSVDHDFQESVQNIFDINKATNRGDLTRSITKGGDDEKSAVTNGIVFYRRGTVKSIESARKKAISDYFDRKFPTCACILDYNRCELIFGDIGGMIMGLNILKSKIENGRAGCIKQIVRDKNGFRKLQRKRAAVNNEEADAIQSIDGQDINVRDTSYADIKINVLIKGKNKNIVGEIVFLLAHMLSFKDELNKYHQIQSQEQYIKNVVSPILPILLDENRLLIAAANSGNINGFLELMVLNNKNEKDLIKLIRNKTTEGLRKRNILHSICKNGHYKAYVFVKNILKDERFIVNLFVPNEKNRNSIEYAVARKHHKIIDDVLRNKGVLKRYQENDDDLFRIVMWSFAWNKDDNVINKIWGKLKITDKEIIKFVDAYTFPEPITEDYIKNPLSKKYHKMKLLHEVASKNTLNRLKQLIEKIGKQLFIKNAFVKNGEDENLVECVLIERRKDKYKLDILNYIFSFNEILDRCKNDDDELYRIALALKPKYDYEITQFIFSKIPQLNDENKLKELNVDDEIIATILQQ